MVAGDASLKLGACGIISQMDPTVSALRAVCLHFEGLTLLPSEWPKLQCNRFNCF